jgi:glycosyltransferase involved in cell wall biosynthesis
MVIFMKNNILIIVDTLKIGGGSDKFAAILGTELHEQGYNISYLTLMDGNPKYSFKGDYYTLNENDIYGNNFKRGLDLLKYSSRIKSICEDLKIDTVISAGDPANFQALISRYLFGNKVRLIITQHMNPGIFLDSRIKYRLIKFFYPKADKVVCVSREVEKILNNDYGIENTLTIYNMVDIQKNTRLSMEQLPDKYSALFESNNSVKGNTDHKIQERSSSHKNMGKNIDHKKNHEGNTGDENKEGNTGHKNQEGKTHFNFINIGRLDRQKGQWFLIRSFRQVVDQYKNAHLFILGEGDLREKLEDLIQELDLSENVFLLGDQENVFPFLVNSDCFVFTSLWEGLPLSLIEALSVNLPVISTDCKTGPREILCPELNLDETINYPYLGEHAILTEPFPNEIIFKNLDEVSLIESEQILFSIMVELIGNPDIRKKYAHGELITQNFSKEKIVNQWNKLLK